MASEVLARRALFLTLSLALAGSGLGLFGAHVGLVAGRELDLILSSLLFSACALITLAVFPAVRLQAVTVVSTSFFGLYLCVGVWIAAYGTKGHFNLFIYLLWFFPLLIFNKLVNQPTAGRLLAKLLLIIPGFLILCLLPRLIAVLTMEQLLLIVSYCLSYLCFGFALNSVSQYREKYVIELERAKSLKVEANILESISDCFISLDSDFRLIYLNDAACNELALNRSDALNSELSIAAPGFLSDAVRTELQGTSAKTYASFFELRSDGNRWYDLRCFPGPDGLSIYFRNITDRKAAEARIEDLAFFDGLTRLPNRQLLRDRLAKALEPAAGQTTMGALLYIDLDDFKTVNDTVGHEAGDTLIQHVALRLATCINQGDTLGRTGGDEFLVVLEGLSENSRAASASTEAVAQRILEAFHQPFVIGDYTIAATASIGATLFRGDSTTIRELMKRTDLALYRAKAEGGNTIRFFNPEMQIDVEARASLLSDLKRAVYNEEFELHYQPQIDSDGVVTGAEALLRWLHPIRGRVPPDQFIPLAEEAGLIVDLGRWVLETACRQLAMWSTNPALEALSVAVNVSVLQLIDPRFVDVVSGTLDNSGANPQRLKLEITESSVMQRVEEVTSTMTTLKARGIGFSIDDFGTGYSSLAYLSRLPSDQIKIDRSFIRNITTNAKDASLVHTIIALAHNLNLSVIAEGVETEVQRDFLKAEDCHLYQGFLYSPAVTASQFEAFVAKSPGANKWKHVGELHHAG